MRRLTLAISLLLIGAVVRAACPTPTTTFAWRNGTSISYYFHSVTPPPCWAGTSLTGIGVDGNINAAFAQWTYADTNQNTAGTTFFFSPSGAYGLDGRTVLITPDCGMSVAAQTTHAVFENAPGILVIADTTFYFNSTNPFGVQNWDPGASNFSTAIQKVMAHEIGHTMGLTDQPVGGGTCAGQVAGQSVMNALCGTNDSMNNLPAPAIGLPACDNSSL